MKIDRKLLAVVAALGAMLLLPAAAAEIVAPTATPRAVQYTVQLRDTLWDIALRFGLPNLDALLAALLEDLLARPA